MYFFSALTRTSLSGTDVSDRVIDFDGDGKISLREAHLYAVYGSINTDIPRSTSEVYLDAWQPWYLRWLTYDRPLSDNVYAQSARLIAATLDIDEDNLSRAARTSETRIAALDNTIKVLESKKEETKKNIQDVQATLKHQVLLRWPQLANAYSQEFQDFFTSTAYHTLQHWISSSDSYTLLEKNQEQLHAQEIELLELNRRKAALLRLKRMIHLGRLMDQLDRHGSEQEKKIYTSLVECENWVPHLRRSSITPELQDNRQDCLP
jgi:hypothetical protein